MVNKQHSNEKIEINPVISSRTFSVFLFQKGRIKWFVVITRLKMKHETLQGVEHKLRSAKKVNVGPYDEQKH